MSREVLTAFSDRMVAALQRRAVAVPSRWALEYIKNADGSAMSFRKFPWQKEMIDSKAPHNVAAKGAQLGISHCILCRGICGNDMEKRDVLYVLPSMNPTGNDFSNTRFDSLVNASPHLRMLYDKANVGLKRTSTNNFYIRGAQSRTGGKSVPAGILVLDEIDEIPREFLPLVRERMSGQEEKLEWDISTPTIPDHGIDKLWQESTQEIFYFPCPSCSKWIHLFYPDCLVIVGDDPDSTRLLKESYLKCPECHAKLEHRAKPEMFAKARFVPTVDGKEKRGFHVNQLYSCTVTPGEVAASAVKANFSEWDAQEFHNSKLGKAFAPEGAKLAEGMINACRSTHMNGSPYTKDVVTMGVDVGAWNHVEVCEWQIGDSIGHDANSNSVPRVLFTGKVRSFEELDSFMSHYRVNFCVIDAMPETRKAFEFAQRWWGYVKMCYYAQGVQAKQLVETAWDSGEPIINVNRTAWMDQALGRFRPAARSKILLPMDLPFEYVEHLKTPNRIWTRDKNGNPVASWKTPDNKADHHAHSRTYAEIALPLALSGGQVLAVESPLDD